MCKKSKYDHVTPLLHQLHWLPIRKRIDYKIIVLTHKALHDQAPKYISDLLDYYTPTRQLRSTSQMLLKERVAKKRSCGDRAFSVCAPKLWNKLPSSIRNIQNLNSFKTALKSYLFKEAFNC